jgi:hypothetical protein
MHRIISAWTTRFGHPHLPTTLRRRLRVAGFDIATIQIVPILNADFDHDTYSGRHIEIIGDDVAHHGVSRDHVAAWTNDLRERAQLGEYFFSLNRYIFTACKP